jgi:hypothetical protein
MFVVQTGKGQRLDLGHDNYDIVEAWWPAGVSGNRFKPA